MKRLLLAAALIAALIAALPLGALAAVPVTHYVADAPSGLGPMPDDPPYSAAVMAGDTLYVAGTTDGGATGNPAPDAKTGAKIVLDHIKATVEQAGLTMDDLVWVQVFASDLKDYAAFNEVYRTYFPGLMPARAFIGAGSLLGGAHFEAMGIAVRRK
jgi:2-iminobutanoate/2-iminopropanoate deaminase